MKIEQIMTRDVKSCRAEQTQDAAAQIMWDADCGCVPVVDGQQRVIGMITDRDICMASHIKGSPPSKLPVSAAMSKTVYTCHADDSLEAAMALMQRHQVRRVPVLGANERLVGILSINDLARILTPDAEGAQTVEATLAAVGEARP